MAPLRLLLRISSEPNPVSWPTVVGNVPTSAFSSSDSEVRRVKRPISLGIVPISREWNAKIRLWDKRKKSKEKKKKTSKLV
jgi:hypothetical protein